MLTLPPELILCILEHITDPATLQACCLVNHKFHHYAQRLLWNPQHMVEFLSLMAWPDRFIGHNIVIQCPYQWSDVCLWYPNPGGRDRRPTYFPRSMSRFWHLMNQENSKRDPLDVYHRLISAKLASLRIYIDSTTVNQRQEEKDSTSLSRITGSVKDSRDSILNRGITIMRQGKAISNMSLI